MIAIKDLEESVELDREALAKIRGGTDALRLLATVAHNQSAQANESNSIDFGALLSGGTSRAKPT